MFNTFTIISKLSHFESVYFCQVLTTITIWFKVHKMFSEMLLSKQNMKINYQSAAYIVKTLSQQINPTSLVTFVAVVVVVEKNTKYLNGLLEQCFSTAEHKCYSNIFQP